MHEIGTFDWQNEKFLWVQQWYEIWLNNMHEYCPNIMRMTSPILHNEQVYRDDWLQKRQRPNSITILTYDVTMQILFRHQILVKERKRRPKDIEGERECRLYRTAAEGPRLGDSWTKNLHHHQLQTDETGTRGCISISHSSNTIGPVSLFSIHLFLPR